MRNDERMALLAWYLDAGVDECISAGAVDRRVSAMPETVVQPASDEAKPADLPNLYRPASALTPPRTSLAPDEAAAASRELADRAKTMAELRKAVIGFEGCGLSSTAEHALIGERTAPLLVLAEAPEAEDDRSGLPFGGPGGALVRRILGCAGLKEDEWIPAYSVFWRPPGGRAPSAQEITVCRPLVERHVALSKAQIVLFLGHAAASLLDTETGVPRLRGREHSYSNPYMDSRQTPCFVSYAGHFLLSQPARKKEAWEDFQTVSHRIRETLIKRP